MSKLIYISILLILPAFQGICQQVLNLNQSQQLTKMDEGVALMNKGEFAEAEDVFRDVLLNVEVVPADLCFYFGKNSYHLDKMSQSIDWLNKYIELKGTSGRFFDAAVEYLKLAEEDIQTQTVSNKESKAVTIKKEIVDCSETPLIRCPVCKGEGVIIERGSLGAAIYKACHYCEETGRMSCENYKLYVVGKFNPEEKN